MGLRPLSTLRVSWTGLTKTGQRLLGTSVRPVGSGTGWGSCYEGRGRSYECPPFLLSSCRVSPPFGGGDLGFVRGDVQEARGFSCGFITVDNEAEGGAT